MSDRRQALIVLHGAIVMFIGLLFGFPFAKAIAAGWGEEAARAWRVAHAGGVAVGLTLIALGAALRCLVFGRAAAAWLVSSAVVSGYAFLLALLIGGVGGRADCDPRGLPSTWWRSPPMSSVCAGR